MLQNGAGDENPQEEEEEENRNLDPGINMQKH